MMGKSILLSIQATCLIRGGGSSRTVSHGNMPNYKQSNPSF